MTTENEEFEFRLRKEREDAAAKGGKPLAINAAIGSLGANVLGLPADFLQNAINLAVAGYGTAKGAITGDPGASPEPLKGKPLTSEWFKQKLRDTGVPGLSPDNPNPNNKSATLAYDLTSRGAILPGGVLPAIGSYAGEQIWGPKGAILGAIAAPVAANAATQVLKPALVSGAERVMQSALKPTIYDLKTGKAAKAINTMLEEGYNATPGGVSKMRAEIDNLNNEIAAAIANSPASIGKTAVANRLYDLTARLKKQVTPSADLKAVQGAWDDFLASHPDQIPVQLAQELKQGTYRALGNKSYGELKGADVEAQKTLARGLKEEIANAVPAVSRPNARESALLNAADLAERRAMMDANKNLLGVGSLSPSLAHLITWIMDRSAATKSLGARGMYQAGTATPLRTPGALERLIQLNAIEQEAQR